MPEPNKLKTCYIDSRRVTPCAAWKKMHYCPSTKVQELFAGVCSVKDQRHCPRCDNNLGPEDFYSDRERYCKTCRQAQVANSRGGISRRRMLWVCDIDGEPCPKANGKRCNRCDKTRPPVSRPPILPTQTAQPIEPAQSDIGLDTDEKTRAISRNFLASRC